MRFYTAFSVTVAAVLVLAESVAATVSFHRGTSKLSISGGGCYIDFQLPESLLEIAANAIRAKSVPSSGTLPGSACLDQERTGSPFSGETPPAFENHGGKWVVNVACNELLDGYEHLGSYVANRDFEVVAGSGFNGLESEAHKTRVCALLKQARETMVMQLFSWESIYGGGSTIRHHAIEAINPEPVRRFAALNMSQRPSMLALNLLPEWSSLPPVIQLASESTPLELEPKSGFYRSTAAGRRLIEIHKGPTAEALANEQLVYKSLAGNLRDLVGEAHAVNPVSHPTGIILVAVDRLGTNSLENCYINHGRRSMGKYRGVGISEARLAALAAAAIAGLRTIHSQGVIHGSLKPTSIILLEGIPDRLVAFTDLRSASFFIEPITGAHIPNTIKPPMDGDRPTSPFAMEGSSPSRRDDMYHLAMALLDVIGNFRVIDRSAPIAEQAVAMRALRTRLAISNVFNEFYAEMSNLEFAQRPNYEAWIDKFTMEASLPVPVPVRDAAGVAAMVGVDASRAVGFEAEYARLVADWRSLPEDSGLPAMCPPESLRLAEGSKVIRLNPNRAAFEGTDADLFISTEPAKEFVIRVGNSRSYMPWETIHEHAFKAVAGAGAGAWALMHPIERGGGLDARCAMIMTVSDYAGGDTVSMFGPSADRDLIQITPLEVAGIAARLIEMVREVHQVGFVHGDIHGGNIVVSDIKTPTLKLIDFGRSSPFVDLPTGLHILPIPQMIGMSMSNAALLAPFELEGDIPTRRDDMYRLAELLFTLLDPTSSPRFRGGERSISAEAWLETARAKRAWRIGTSFDPSFNEFKEEMANLGFTERPNYERWIARFRRIMDNGSHGRS